MARKSWIETVAIAIALIAVGYFYYHGSKGPGRADPYPGGMESTAPIGAGDPALAAGSAGADAEAAGGSCGGIRSPIELKLTLLGANEFDGDDAGGQVVIGVDLKPLIDAPDLRWFLRVPDALTKISGIDSWEGRMAKDEERSFQLTLAVPDGRPYELYSRAEAYLDNGDVVTSGAGLRIDLGPEDPGPHPPFERVDDRGRRVISYKGESGEGGR